MTGTAFLSPTLRRLALGCTLTLLLVGAGAERASAA